MASANDVEAESIAVTASDVEAVGNQTRNDGGAELIDIKRFLSSYCDIDANYLRPYINYIQAT